MGQVPHYLVTDSQAPGGASCVCGADLALLLPHYPVIADVEKAYDLHIVALAVEGDL